MRVLMTWRSDGALFRRSDLQGAGSSDDTTETFTYDALNRVTQAATSLGGGGTIRNLGFGFDAHGNLTGKSSRASGDAQTTGYLYANSSQPHRLTSATIGGVATSFHYDTNGNITRYQATGTDDTWLDYDARNQVTRITVGASAGTTSPTAMDEFWYGPEGARFLKRETWTEDSTQQQSLTVYLYGGVYEEVHPLHDGDTDWHRKIQASSAALIRVTKPAGQSTTETIEYLHRDHLGSVHKVTDGQGNVLHDLAFDPFGGRREADWSGDIDATSLKAILDDLGKNTSRGFTDHEHLDRTGFIHMNGRVYDPRIGRFVQPDPFVPDPTFSQDYNRYAYVVNSPLSFTDPSGYCRGPDNRSNTICELQRLDYYQHMTWSNGFDGPGGRPPIDYMFAIDPRGSPVSTARPPRRQPGQGGGSGGGATPETGSPAPGGGGTTPDTIVQDPVVGGGGGTPVGARPDAAPERRVSSQLDWLTANAHTHESACAIPMACAAGDALVATEFGAGAALGGGSAVTMGIRYRLGEEHFLRNIRGAERVVQDIPDAYDRQLTATSQTAQRLSSLSHGLGYLGFISSGAMYTVNMAEGKYGAAAVNATDVLMTGIGMIPPYGTAVSVAYFTGRFVVDYTSR